MDPSNHFHLKKMQGPKIIKQRNKLYSIIKKKKKK